MSLETFNRILTIDSPNMYLSKLEDRFGEYSEFIKINYPNVDIDNLEFLNNLILSSIRSFLERNESKALQNLLENNLYNYLQSSLTRINENKFFYRLRNDKILKKYQNNANAKYNIFHIPFRLRHKVGYNRFSKPGFPGFYLANNVETCLLENNIDISKSLLHPKIYNTHREKVFLNVGIFKNSTHIPIFDLSFKRFDSFSDDNEKLYYLSILPLIIACHTKVIYSEKKLPNFKYEYIFPNLILDSLLIINEGASTPLALMYSSVKDDRSFLNSKNIFLHPISKNNLEYCTILSSIFLGNDNMDVNRNYIYHNDIFNKSIAYITLDGIKNIISDRISKFIL